MLHTQYWSACNAINKVRQYFRPLCFAFPDDKYRPTFLFQFGSLSLVPLNVACQFGLPELLPTLRKPGGSAPRMAVPKTAMHEYNDASRGEHEVGDTGQPPIM